MNKDAKAKPHTKKTEHWLKTLSLRTVQLRMLPTRPDTLPSVIPRKPDKQVIEISLGVFLVCILPYLNASEVYNLTRRCKNFRQLLRDPTEEAHRGWNLQMMS
jgi:hypothetical protein